MLNMSISESSSSDDEQEKERKRQLQEAVCGVDLPSTSSIPPAKKSRLSKQTPRQGEDETTSAGLIVSTEMQKFLAKKLTQFLDEQYEVTTSAPTSVEPEPPLASSIRLLCDSYQPVSHTSSTHASIRTESAHLSESDSSESESESSRLKEAAVDPQTLLDNR